MTKPLRSLLGPALLIVFGTLFALLLGELIARLVFVPVPATIDEGAATFSMYEPHEKLGWRPRPNMTMRSKRFDATFTTNSRGLRDRERELAKPPGLRRIVVIGDSFTWGWGVDQNETFPKVLESRLERTDVVNLGVSGYGLNQAFDYLKLEGILYEPDMVILALCQNDIYRSSSLAQPAAWAPRAPYSRSTSSSLLGLIKIWLSEHLALYQVAQQAINTNRTLIKAFVAIGLKEELEGFEGLDPNLVPALRKYPPELQTSHEATQKELLEIRDWLAARRVGFILALIPAVQAIDERVFAHSIAYTVFEPADFELDKPYKALEAFARSNGIEVVNAYPALHKRQQAGATLYLPNDVHFNPLGQQAFAAEILTHLQSSW